MNPRYSITNARRNLDDIVRQLEQTPEIELTHRGEPVAVLVSIREMQRLHHGQSRFWDAYESFRETHDLADMDIDSAIFADLRDKSPGRGSAW
ncbi:MAG: type II toxin-antitoxin system Phd/YefM family antitoxin [Caldilineaceae bacterium]|nr:type II toxin-antitoxin system Phd/YefM family antitoxin [Caldilineaceae bacterium]